MSCKTRVAVLGLFLAGLELLGLPAATAQTNESDGGVRETAILAINDVYRFAGVDDGRSGGLARVRNLRLELEARYPDLLMLHGGDFLAPSLISRTCEGELMVHALNHLDGEAGMMDDRMFVVFGNHEFDLKHGSTLSHRISESEFAWLDTNVELRACCDLDEPRSQGKLVKRWTVASGGIQIGIFGLTIDSTKPYYVEDFLDVEATAACETEILRREGAEVVIALTHLPLAQDCAILKNLGKDGPDLIVGGHDHEKSKGCPGEGREEDHVYKADADARTASVIVLKLDDGECKEPPCISHDFRYLDETNPKPVKPDPRLQDRAEDLVKLHDKLFCGIEDGGFEMEKGRCLGQDEAVERARTQGLLRDFKDQCLDDLRSHTNAEFVGEETEIRRRETSLGNWITDLMREEYEEKCGAQVAFINSGSLRLNQTLPAGSELKRRHLEELVQFDNAVELIEIDGATLQQVLERSIEEWPGSGHWLQVSGLAFRHDAKAGKVTDLTLLDGPRSRPIRPGDRIRAVVPRFLVNPKDHQDGYTMLSLDQRVEDCAVTVASLKNDLIGKALEKARQAGIDPPQPAGRICQEGEQEVCLAQGGSRPQAPGGLCAWIPGLVAAAILVLLPFPRRALGLPEPDSEGT